MLLKIFLTKSYAQTGTYWPGPVAPDLSLIGELIKGSDDQKIFGTTSSKHLVTILRMYPKHQVMLQNVLRATKRAKDSQGKSVDIAINLSKLGISEAPILNTNMTQSGIVIAKLTLSFILFPVENVLNNVWGIQKDQW